MGLVHLFLQQCNMLTLLGQSVVIFQARRECRTQPGVSDASANNRHHETALESLFVTHL